MIRKYILLASMLLASCSEQPPRPQEQSQEQPKSAPGQTSAPSQPASGGMVEHMATAAVGGFAAGAGAAVGHHAATAAIDKFKTRRRAARIQSLRARRR